MSWSLWSDGSVAKDATDSMSTTTGFTVDPKVEGEVSAQRSAAYDAVKLLVGAVGRDGDQVRVAISGHANPGHGPRDGWADETITVTVTAVPRVE